ncbi:MAG: molybdenum cofactor guanylyltransferase [Oscillospiraceae bacterium]|nr:molybdenum cofactor guanylyltransferase [Oscillospiraceae bacterium]
MQSIAGCILTGGKNRRMEGNKKLFLSYNGEAFFQRILRAFAPFEQVYLSVDEKAPYEGANLPMIVDRYQAIGAMGGIYSALRECTEEALFFVACDMPHIDAETVQRVIEAYHSNPGLTLVEADGRIQPLFGIYPKVLLPVVERQIQLKNYRMRSLLEQIPYNTVSLTAGSHAADNINTVEEYKELVSRFETKNN